MTHKEKLRIVGETLRAADPDTAAMLKREDGVTSLKALGEYVYSTDPAQFERIVEDYEEYLVDMHHLSMQENTDEQPGSGAEPR